LSHQLSKQRSGRSLSPNQTEKVNQFFDYAEAIIERSGTLLSKCEPVVLKLFLFAHLLMDLGLVIWLLLNK